MSRNSARSLPPSRSRAPSTSAAIDAGTPGDRDPGELEDPLGLAPLPQAGRGVGAHDPDEVVVALLASAPQASYTCRTAPRRGAPRRPRSPRPRQDRRPPRPGASSSRTSAPGSSGIRLCGARPVGTSTTRARPSWAAASWASTRWPTCGGLNAEPSTPSAPCVAASSLRCSLRTAIYSLTWPVAFEHVLRRRQLAKADRPARVELLGRVADLGAHPELEAVGEPGRRVDVDRRRVHGLR